MKKLKFHVPDSEGKSKCNKIHIGEKVHGCPMKEVKHDAYHDCKNTLNIESSLRG